VRRHIGGVTLPALIEPKRRNLPGEDTEVATLSVWKFNDAGGRRQGRIDVGESGQ
jgi:hypothetical protein